MDFKGHIILYINSIIAQEHSGTGKFLVFYLLPWYYYHTYNYMKKPVLCKPSGGRKYHCAGENQRPAAAQGLSREK